MLGIGYSVFIGRCSVLEAELWGVVKGLRLAWNVGIQVVLLEVDNDDVARMVRDSMRVSGLHGLVSLIRELLDRDWMVRVRQVWRSTNRVADGIAKLARKSLFRSCKIWVLLLGFFDAF
ncbi:hypothetical protein V6N13_071033 [Hibiscus sabdariffa]|uniref:RNase H type-1 domain-containing protein n=1 Tax=Hibiscus sabdariffa TaxID=183260 RepID=A0ABR2TFE3_9ROSI